jgi:hypothetical protein
MISTPRRSQNGAGTGAPISEVALRRLVPSKAQRLGRWIARRSPHGLTVAAVTDLRSDELPVVQRPHEALLADLENPLRQRRIRARLGEPLHGFPLKGNPDLQFGDFAVRPIEFGIPVAQPRTLSILMTTSDLPLADDSPCYASPRLSHVDNSARPGRTA